jgi:hypothetical protein
MTDLTQHAGQIAAVIGMSVADDHVIVSGRVHAEVPHIVANHRRGEARVEEEAIRVVVDVNLREERNPVFGHHRTALGIEMVAETGALHALGIR